MFYYEALAKPYPGTAWGGGGGGGAQGHCPALLKQSDLGLQCLSRLFWQATRVVINKFSFNQAIHNTHLGATWTKHCS